MKLKISLALALGFAGGLAQAASEKCVASARHDGYRD